MRIRHCFLFLFLTGWLTSCATVPEQPVPQDQSVSWGSRSQVLTDIQHWDLNALIAIRNNVKNDSGSANMQWQQNKQNYSILLFGPLGANSTKLTGKPGNVLLETAKGEKFKAKTPEQLVTEQTGWKLPVSNLYYWIRGLPVPDLSAEKKFDSYNHLIELTQAGWRVQFLRYTSVNHVDMPTKIFLDNPELNVKIIISKWQI